MRQRKPLVYLIVIVPLLWVGGCAVVVALARLLADYKGVPISDLPDLNAVLVTIPGFLIWIPISLLLSNLVIRCVPPLRRRAEAYVSESGHPDFSDSQRALAKVLVVLSVVCIPAIVVGFVY